MKTIFTNLIPLRIISGCCAIFYIAAIFGSLFCFSLLDMLPLLEGIRQSGSEEGIELFSLCLSVMKVCVVTALGVLHPKTETSARPTTRVMVAHFQNLISYHFIIYSILDYHT